ncbi:MAG TPA: hypothetical protein VG797_06320, partial [Phycisphaerales bacterium]|nr:hypothetical protein [Phycisphaerales bacterium]
RNANAAVAPGTATGGSAGGAGQAPAEGFESVQDVVDGVLSGAAVVGQPASPGAAPAPAKPAAAGGVAAPAAVAPIQEVAPSMVAGLGAGLTPVVEKATKRSAVTRLLGPALDLVALPLKPLPNIARDYIGYFGAVTAFYGVCLLTLAVLRSTGSSGSIEAAPAVTSEHEEHPASSHEGGASGGGHGDAHDAGGHSGHGAHDPSGPVTLVMPQEHGHAKAAHADSGAHGEKAEHAEKPADHDGHGSGDQPEHADAEPHEAPQEH